MSLEWISINRFHLGLGKPVYHVHIRNAHKLVRGENLQECKQTNKGNKSNQKFLIRLSTSMNASNQKQTNKNNVRKFIER